MKIYRNTCSRCGHEGKFPFLGTPDQYTQCSVCAKIDALPECIILEEDES